MDSSEGFSQALAAGNMVALPLALLGGLVAGMNPCCLALYPAAAVACCSMQGQTIKRPLGNAVAFVLGIAVAVASLGVLAAYIGRVAVMGTPFRYAIAFLPILMGVYAAVSLRHRQRPAGHAGRDGGGRRVEAPRLQPVRKLD